MEKMSVRIYYSLKEADETLIERTVDVSEEDLVELIPSSPSGNGGGWPYWREAEALVCSIVKEEVFPDELTPVDDMKVLRQLGVTSLSFAFDHEVRGHISSQPLHPE
ncbi:hypothetical protein [Herbaspirillum sp. SJZ107]|uniref:hypothetical protein n=1 Tax=Herbaspirillum sp. SJZ107 TaxID=2572881 RepID=UPI001153CF7F|nr:hypothetical protein [Herbaspirillum sp. SJZ107]TQK00168.1 hypothetical protein FBX97_5833 [Herbaspirillum sp. SJZ107]